MKHPELFICTATFTISCAQHRAPHMSRQEALGSVCPLPSRTSMIVSRASGARLHHKHHTAHFICPCRLCTARLPNAESLKNKQGAGTKARAQAPPPIKKIQRCYLGSALELACLRPSAPPPHRPSECVIAKNSNYAAAPVKKSHQSLSPLAVAGPVHIMCKTIRLSAEWL